MQDIMNVIDVAETITPSKYNLSLILKDNMSHPEVHLRVSPISLSDRLVWAMNFWNTANPNVYFRFISQPPSPTNGANGENGAFFPIYFISDASSSCPPLAIPIINGRFNAPLASSSKTQNKQPRTSGV